MPLVRTGTARLHVDREGSGEPLLWITGFGISSEIFGPVVPRYASQFDCIRYDNRGSGRSRAPWLLTSVPELAGDAVRLLDALAVDSAHVYGLSMGGMIAQEMAIRFPDRVRALVLGATAPSGQAGAWPTGGAAAALAACGTSLAARGASPQRRAELVAGALFTREFRDREPARTREALALLGAHRAGPPGLLSHWWATIYHDTRARLPRVQAPTLVLHGDRDVLTPLREARVLAEQIPDATLEVLPGAAHGYLFEQPERAHRAFVDWLAARSPVPAGRPLSGLAARGEPLTRHLGLPVGALRTARSLSGVARRRR